MGSFSFASGNAAQVMRLPLHVLGLVLTRVIPLDEIRQHTDELGEEFALVRRGNRLSVLPVSAAQWKLLLALE